MGIKSVAVTIKCDGREGDCRRTLEVELEIFHHAGSRECSLDDTEICSADPNDIGSLVDKEGWRTLWHDHRHFCPDCFDDLEEILGEIIAKKYPDTAQPKEATS